MTKGLTSKRKTYSNNMIIPYHPRKNNIKFGRFVKPTNNYFDKHCVYYCPECKSVWAFEEMLPKKTDDNTWFIHLLHLLQKMQSDYQTERKVQRPQAYAAWWSQIPCWMQEMAQRWTNSSRNYTENEYEAWSLLQNGKKTRTLIHEWRWDERRIRWKSFWQLWWLY